MYLKNHLDEPVKYVSISLGITKGNISVKNKIRPKKEGNAPSNVWKELASLTRLIYH